MGHSRYLVPFVEMMREMTQTSDLAILNSTNFGHILCSHGLSNYTILVLKPQGYEAHRWVLGVISYRRKGAETLLRDDMCWSSQAIQIQTHTLLMGKSNDQSRFLKLHRIKLIFGRAAIGAVGW